MDFNPRTSDLKRFSKQYTQGSFWYRRICGATMTSNTAVAKRMQCVLIIPAGMLSHEGRHIHSKEVQPSHSCEKRCVFVTTFFVAMRLTEAAKLPELWLLLYLATG